MDYESKTDASAVTTEQNPESKRKLIDMHTFTDSSVFVSACTPYGHHSFDSERIYIQESENEFANKLRMDHLFLDEDIQPRISLLVRKPSGIEYIIDDLVSLDLIDVSVKTCAKKVRCFVLSKRSRLPLVRKTYDGSLLPRIWKPESTLSTDNSRLMVATESAPEQQQSVVETGVSKENLTLEESTKYETIDTEQEMVKVDQTRVEEVSTSDLYGWLDD